MTHLILLVIVLMAGGMYFMTPAERTRILALLKVKLGELREVITLEGLTCEEFFDTLRARTRRVILTPVLIASSAIFTILSWTGNADHGGLRHLLIAMLVHPRLLDLVVNAAALLQIGLILERLVGRLAFATVYVSGGAVVGLLTFALTPDGVGAGATGSVLAAYGLLLATSAWSAYRRTSLTIPLEVAKRILPIAGVFVLYHMVRSDFGGMPMLVALLTGIASGIVVSWNVGERTPPFRPLVRTMAGATAVVMLYAVIAMHRTDIRTTDLRPEIERVIAVEHRTAGIYDQAVDRFRKGRLNAKALADLIQQTILPELQALNTRLHTLEDIPPEDQPLVATVEEFLKLRDESWQMRAAALVKGDIMALRQADKKQQDSLDTFRRMAAQQLGGG